jgi:hypothetical protein
MPGAADSPGRDAAESLSLDAVRFLASDPDRLQRFLDLTGIAPEMLRARLGDAAFLAGVLDYLLGDEALLIEFAEWAPAPPEAIAQARRALGQWPADT